MISQPLRHQNFPQDIYLRHPHQHDLFPELLKPVSGSPYDWEGSNCSVLILCLHDAGRKLWLPYQTSFTWRGYIYNTINAGTPLIRTRCLHSFAKHEQQNSFEPALPCTLSGPLSRQWRQLRWILAGSCSCFLSPSDSLKSLWHPDTVDVDGLVES